jgi:HSP20 family protein
VRYRGPGKEKEMLNLLEPANLYRDLFDFRQDFEDIFNKMVGFTRIPEPKLLTEAFVPPIEAWTDTDNKKFHLRVAIPGIEPKDVKLEVQGKMLMISGERKKVETKKDLNYHHREFHYGTFERILPLPEGVEEEKLVAEFNNGVLEINAPLVAAALPRKIEIKPLLKKAA